MAGRGVALDAAGGGDRIPTLRADRARLAAALLAVALGAALAAYPALSARRAVEAVALLGAAGVAAVVLALAAGGRLLPLPLLLLAGELELLDALDGAPRAAFVVFAAGLLVLGELVGWSLGLRAVAVVDRSVVAAQGRFLAAVVAGALAVAALAEAASRVPLAGGLGDAVIGTAAAVLVVAAVAALARSARAL